MMGLSQGEIKQSKYLVIPAIEFYLNGKELGFDSYTLKRLIQTLTQLQESEAIKTHRKTLDELVYPIRVAALIFLVGEEYGQVRPIRIVAKVCGITNMKALKAKVSEFRLKLQEGHL